MAVKLNFTDNGVRYYSQDFNQQFLNLLNKSGLMREETDFFVTQSYPPSLKVNVANGGAYFDGMYIYSDTKLTFDVPRNDFSDERRDIIVLSVDKQKGTAAVNYKVGTNGSDEPRVENHELLIAFLYVPPAGKQQVITENEIIMTTHYIFMSKAEIEKVVKSISV